MSNIFSRDGRTICAGNPPRELIHIQRCGNDSSGYALAPYQADSIARQVFALMQSGAVIVPVNLEQTNAIDARLGGQSRPLFQHLAARVNAIANCKRAGNKEWIARHAAVIRGLVREYMPSGSGIDSGTRFRSDLSRDSLLAFETSFHHMHDGGAYDGWTEHMVRVRPCLMFGFTLSISGPNRNDIKEYLRDVFSAALERELSNDDPAILRAMERA